MSQQKLAKRQKLRLLAIGPSPPPHNGMTTATELVKKAMDGAEIDYVHLDTADRRGLANVGKFDLGNLVLAAKHGIRFMWLLMTKRPRVIYVPIAQVWLAFLRDCLFLVPARLLRRKVVIHLHGGHFKRFYRETSPLMRWIIRYALGRACCAIVLGQNVRDAFDGILARDKIRVVPNGIPDSFAAGAPERKGAQAPVLLFLSSLTADKGFLDLLRVLPKVWNRAGNIRAVFAGECRSQQDKDTAVRLIEIFGLQPVVEFVGAVEPERKRELLEKADAFIFPTAYRFEGHPYVILEAMAAGLPVVSTNVACIPETVRDGVEGFLVESGDLDALADRTAQLVVDESLRKRMGEAGRQRFLGRYTFNKFAERMKVVFAESFETSQGVSRLEELPDASTRKP